MGTGFQKKAALLIVRRDRQACAWCGAPARGVRGIDWSIHHRRPRGRGGSKLAWVDQPANGVVVCGNGTQGCHGVIEAQRGRAMDYGFLVSLNGVRTAAQVPIKHAAYGWCLLVDDGSVIRGVEEGKEWASWESSAQH